MGCNLVCFNNSGITELNNQLNGDILEIRQDKTQKYEKQNSQTTSISFDNVQKIEDYSLILQVLISKFKVHEKLNEFNTRSALSVKLEKKKSKRSKKRERSKRKQKKVEIELENIAEEPINNENFVISDSCDCANEQNQKNLSKKRSSKASNYQNADNPDFEIYEKKEKTELGAELNEDHSGKFGSFVQKSDLELKEEPSRQSLNSLPPKNPKKEKIKKKLRKVKKERKKSFSSESSPNSSLNFNQSWENLSDVSSIYRSLMQTGQLGIRKLLSADGQEIDCDFANCPFSGEAKYVWPDKSVYEGSWVNNKMHGSGIMLWPDGRVYKGEFNNGAREGTGTMTWPNGNSYEGTWKSGKQDGAGVLSIKGRDKNVIIRGVWAQGMRKSTVYNT